MANSIAAFGFFAHVFATNIVPNAIAAHASNPNAHEDNTFGGTVGDVDSEIVIALLGAVDVYEETFYAVKMVISNKNVKNNHYRSLHAEVRNHIFVQFV